MMPRHRDTPAPAPARLDRHRDYRVSVTFRPADPAGFCEVQVEEDPSGTEEYTALVAAAIMNLTRYLQAFLNAQAEYQEAPSSIVLFPSWQTEWEQ